jgi:hypothetical protein
MLRPTAPVSFGRAASCKQTAPGGSRLQGDLHPAATFLNCSSPRILLCARWNATRGARISLRDGDGADPTHKDMAMKAQGATLIAAASLLVAGLAAASAQSQSPGTGSAPGATHSQDQCWDTALNQVRRMQSDKTTTESQGGAATTGSTGTTGAAAGGEPKAGAGPAGAGSATATRPAGMPNC